MSIKIIVDTETTGLDPYRDDLLQVSIIDTCGVTRFNSYICPTKCREWPDAMAVNNITPEMVADAPKIQDVRRQIQDIFDKADTVIGYNLPFDLEFLRACGNIRPLIDTRIIDVMQDYAEHMHLHKWAKLVDAAYSMGFDWSNLPAHNSLNDCLATLYIYKKMGGD